MTRCSAGASGSSGPEQKEEILSPCSLPRQRAWPSKATGPSKSPIVSWGCDSSSYALDPFSQPFSQLESARSRESWNKPISPIPTSTASGNVAMGPLIRAPAILALERVGGFLPEAKPHFKRACVAKTPGAAPIHRIGAGTGIAGASEPKSLSNLVIGKLPPDLRGVMVTCRALDRVMFIKLSKGISSLRKKATHMPLTASLSLAKPKPWTPNYPSQFPAPSCHGNLWKQGSMKA